MSSKYLGTCCLLFLLDDIHCSLFPCVLGDFTDHGTMGIIFWFLCKELLLSPEINFCFPQFRPQTQRRVIKLWELQQRLSPFSTHPNWDRDIIYYFFLYFRWISILSLQRKCSIWVSVKYKMFLIRFPTKLPIPRFYFLSLDSYWALRKLKFV